MRPGVDVLDHRILLRRLKILRPMNDAENVGHAVAPPGDEALGKLITGLPDLAGVGFLQFAEQGAGDGIAQFVHRRLVHARPGGDEEPVIRRPLQRVIAISGGQG